MNLGINVVKVIDDHSLSALAESFARLTLHTTDPAPPFCVRRGDLVAVMVLALEPCHAGTGGPAAVGDPIPAGFCLVLVEKSKFVRNGLPKIIDAIEGTSGQPYGV